MVCQIEVQGTGSTACAAKHTGLHCALSHAALELCCSVLNCVVSKLGCTVLQCACALARWAVCFVTCMMSSSLILLLYWPTLKCCVGWPSLQKHQTSDNISTTISVHATAVTANKVQHDPSLEVQLYMLNMYCLGSCAHATAPSTAAFTEQAHGMLRVLLCAAAHDQPLRILHFLTLRNGQRPTPAAAAACAAAAIARLLPLLAAPAAAAPAIACAAAATRLSPVPCVP